MWERVTGGRGRGGGEGEGGMERGRDKRVGWKGGGRERSEMGEGGHSHSVMVQAL